MPDPQASSHRVEAVLAAARSELGRLEGAAFVARWEAVRADLVDALDAVYGEAADVSALTADLLGDALAAATARPEPLRVLDRVREVDPSWFLAAEMVGYVCYADRFAGGLKGVADRLDYLGELGIRYLHLMPLLRPRDGENDGGYAVQDYDAVDPRLGDMADLEALTEAMHDRGMALCVDLVLNHTAKEHDWARKAFAGDPAYRDFFWFFPDRSGPDAYERTLPEVFPDMAPGSFSQLPPEGELGGWWVWTTFREFQWDLNWSNPEVLRAMTGVLLRLANHGVDVVRLDAAPFLWKRMGTDCQNQPEAHRVIQALRALTRLAAPGVLLKAEAIVGPDQLVQYLGGHDHFRPECDIAYDNQLMVMLWSALAARDARLPAQALGRRRRTPRGTGWVTYVRGHDDIGWAVADEDAWAVGINPFTHRDFLAAFYSGRHEGSFARGLDFQPDPATRSARTSGMSASLAGLELALEEGSEKERDAALTRLETLYAVAYSYGGIPVVWMGDELAMRNDPHWADEAEHADDNRWVHRPHMDWEAADRRGTPGSVEARMFSALRRLGEVRRSTPALRSDAETWSLQPSNPRVLSYVRYHARSAPVLALANFSDHPETVDGAVLAHAGIQGPRHLHSTAGRIEWEGGSLRLPAWGFLWVTSQH